MKRQGEHSETNVSPKPLPLKRDFGANYSGERLSSLSAEGAPLRKSAKVEWLWQLERETAPPAISQVPSHNEVLGRRNCDMSYNPFQPSVTSHRLKEEEQEASKEQEPKPPPPQSRHEIDMEVGYEDFSTLESTNHNFSDELKQLDKQQKDAEEAEHTRHLERIIEISKEYKEKRLILRAQQEEQRRRFLENEAGEQLQHYIQPSITGFHQDSKEWACYSYRPPPSSNHHHHQPHHGSDMNELYRDRYPQQLTVSRTEPGIGTATPQTQVKEGRVPLPAGRVYNNTSKAASTRYH